MIGLLAAGVAMVVGGGLAQALQPPAVPADDGSVPARATVANADARLRSPAGVASSRAVPPVRVALPGVTARVVHADVTGGALDVPDDVDQVGWWQGGAGVTSASGTIVLAGHVDSARQGIGAFARLRDLRPGAQVRLIERSGLSRTFVVTGRRSYAKSSGLPSALFDQRVALRLVLITCTGRFDPVLHSYEDNLVVYAVPT